MEVLKSLFRKKSAIELENECRIQSLYKGFNELNKNNRYTTRIIIDYLEKVLESEKHFEDFYEAISKGNERFSDFNEMADVLLSESIYKNQKYIHYKNKKEYTVISLVVPLRIKSDFAKRIFVHALHTEKNELIKVYMKHNFYYHNYNKEVLVFYTDGQNKYVRPYSMFFGKAKDNNKKEVDRFTLLAKK